MHSVIIVEDERLVRIGLKNSIDWASLNMKVIADEANGQAAWQTFQKERPDIVITDIVMPIMDGIQLISNIRKVDNKAKIIILTCMEDFKTAQAAVTMGVSGYIVKLAMTDSEIEEVLLKVKNELADSPDNKAVKAITENKSQLNEQLFKNYLYLSLYSDLEFVAKIKERNPHQIAHLH